MQMTQRVSEINKFSQQFTQMCAPYFPSGMLEFAIDPLLPPTLLDEGPIAQNSGRTALSDSPINANFLHHESSLYELRNTVQEFPASTGQIGDKKNILLQRISSKMDSLHAYKRLEWQRQRVLGERSERDIRHTREPIYINTGT